MPESLPVYTEEQTDRLYECHLHDTREKAAIKKHENRILRVFVLFITVPNAQEHTMETEGFGKPLVRYKSIANVCFSRCHF